MRHALTTISKDRGKAQHVLNKLLAAGYARADVVMVPAAQASASQDDVEREHGIATPPAHRFSGFRRLWTYGSFPGHAREASTPWVVTLTTETDQEAARGAGLVKSFISVGVGDDRDRDALTASAPMPTDDLPGMVPEALQGRRSEKGDSFGTLNSDHMHLIGTRKEVEAFRYGREMHTSERYRNRSWDEVDDVLERGWASRNPLAPRWAALQPAIRRGWNAETPEIDEDSYYRTHWNAPYGHHARDQVAVPAQGRKGGRHYKLRLRLWKAAALHHNASWAVHHAGDAPPWERFKDAFFHGWGKIDLGQ